jgi:hypothetical protein
LLYHKETVDAAWEELFNSAPVWANWKKEKIVTTILGAGTPMALQIRKRLEGALASNKQDDDSYTPASVVRAAWWFSGSWWTCRAAKESRAVYKKL